MRSALRVLADGGRLSPEESAAAMRDILSGRATEAQIAGFAMALTARGPDLEEIVGLATAAREFGTQLPCGGEVLDTCGTGGDGLDTFNISTTAAVVAAACGVPVAKHGNRSASSACGSADVLEELGVRVDLEPWQAADCLADNGIAFLFAPVFQPAFRHVAGVRRELAVRTVFNILGPLCNPAGARFRTLGVSDPGLLRTTAEALRRLGTRRALVFRSEDGMDELSTCAPSQVVEVNGAHTRSYRLDPRDLGLAPARIGDLAGGDAAVNARIVRAVLGGQRGPRRDVVLLNTAAALRVSGRGEDWQEALATAARAIDDGRAAALLEAWAVWKPARAAAAPVPATPAAVA